MNSTKTNSSVMKNIFYLLLALLLTIGVYFIIHNATWLVGDDSACISHTSWGKCFSLSDYTIPETGRFYPMAFMLYDVLPFLGLSSVHAHFGLHAISMIIMVLSLCVICRLSMSSCKLSFWDYIALFAIGAIGMVRPYRYFLTTEYSLWVDYLLVIVWTLCTYFVHEKQSITAAFCGFISIAYFCFCLEVNPVLPCCYGIVGCLMWKKSSLLERNYYLSMLLTTIVYFVLYFVLIYMNIGDEIYDASHGENLPIFEVAVRMFYAQKIYWIGLIILIVKAYQIFNKKASLEWWDNLLLTGFAYYLGCVVIHLHHTVYYWTAALCMIPSMIHYLHKWKGEKWTVVIVFILAAIMCRRFPQIVKENQSHRLKSIELQQLFVNEIKKDKNVYYFAPEVLEVNNNHYAWRKQKRECLPIYIGNAIDNHQFTLNVISEFSHKPGIYILPYENNELKPYSNDEIITAGSILFQGGYGNLTIVDIQ